MQRVAEGMVFLVAMVLVTGCTSSELSTTAPTAATSTAFTRKPLPPLAPSVVDAPIAYALEPALAALEAVVPQRFGDISNRIVNPSNKRQSVAFAATRSPFVVAFDGTRVTLTTIVSYQGKGWYSPPIGPDVSASCGINSEPPRIRIVLASDIGITPEWNFRSKTRLRSVKPLTETERDQCRVTVFNIDVTDKVVNAMEPLLADKLPAVDRKILAFDFRSKVERWYNMLNRSIRISDSLWMVLSPDQVRLGGLRLEDSALIADVRLYARPTLAYGPKPADVMTSLPKLMPASLTVGDTTRLRLEGLMGYENASKLLTAQLAGRGVTRYGRRVQVKSARLYPLNDGRVALALSMEGAVRGDAYFVGTPSVDTVLRVLTVPDLDFDVNTANSLVAGLAWLKKGDLVNELRAKATVPLTELLDSTSALAERAINRELTRGVKLFGTVQTGRLKDVVAEPAWIVVRAEATGKLGLEIDREIKVRKARPKLVTDTAAKRPATK